MSQDGFKVTVELSSVNRKQTEISVNLPREMEMLEAQIRDEINHHIARGPGHRARLPPCRRGQAVGADAPECAAGQGLRPRTAPPGQAAQTGQASHAGSLARAPGVFQTDEEIAEAEDLWPAVEQGAQAALGHHGENARARRGRTWRRIWHARDRRDAQGVRPDAAARAPRSPSGIASSCSHRIKSAGLDAPGAGRRAAAQGSRLFRRPLGHLGGIDAAAKPFPAVRRLREVQGTGRAARWIFWRRK